VYPVNKRDGVQFILIGDFTQLHDLKPQDQQQASRSAASLKISSKPQDQQEA
jgi:hypothetical protein